MDLCLFIGEKLGKQIFKRTILYNLITFWKCCEECRKAIAVNQIETIITNVKEIYFELPYIGIFTLQKFCKTTEK